jgi:tetratricopeptide (TPR) repeat protein
LLQLLLREFPAGSNASIAIIVTSHDRDVFTHLDAASERHVEDVEYPTVEEQIQILVNGIGLGRSTAAQIVERVGAATHAQGGLFWLLQVVGNLARSGTFVKSAEGFELPGGHWPEDVFIPDELRDVLTEHLRRFPQYRIILACAACACEGREFSASVVTEALGMPQLELLVQLDRIDRETSIVYDVRERDDAFAFQSSFMLDVVRDELRVMEHGPASPEVPQIIRGYHARLAAVLEKSLQTNSNKLYRVANHYYAAGASCADKAMHYCLEAANAACAMLNFHTAERYLQRAEECAHVLGRTKTIETQRLFIECVKTHVTGTFREQAEYAKRGVQYLEKHPDAPIRLRLVIAQIHYDAGKSSGDRSWFDKSLHIGEQMIAGAKSPYEEAIGRHFVGISLPRERHAERVQQLRKAMQLVESSATKKHPDAELLGRIVGSLAEQLSRGTTMERDEARELFTRRLKLNERHKIGDPQGVAMTHGGLGRLAYFYERKDIPAARYHFQKDLDISEAIGDLQGQIQMHSLLGGCALEENDVNSAVNHYQRSWELSPDAVSRFFAGAGLLNCYARHERVNQVRQIARELLDVAREQGIPHPCRDDVVDAINVCAERAVCTEIEQLLKIVADKTTSESTAG